MTSVTLVTISAAFVFGMVLALLGSLKLTLAKRLNLGESRVGLLLSAFNFTLMPMMLLTGMLIDAYGVKWILLGASCMTAVAIVTLSINPTYSRAFIGALLAGLGSAGLSTASIVLMPKAFYYSMKEAPAAENLGNVFFALGALVTPVLTDVLLRGLGFHRAVRAIALLCLLPGLFAAMTPADDLKPTQDTVQLVHQVADLMRPFFEKTVWLAAAVFFLYAPLEAAINIWATTYLSDFGHGERRVAWVLSGFWAAFLASRLLAALALHRWPPVHGWDVWLLIIVPALLVGVLLGNLAGTASPGAAWRGILLLGFLLGPIFPTLVGALFYHLDRTKVYGYGTAYGTLFAVGSVGSLVLAPIIGVRATRRNVQTALRIPMLMALALTLAALVFVVAK